MWLGAHWLLYSSDPDADRAFLRDTLGLSGVDTGGGWLIFKLPPAEMGVHPLEGPSMPPAARAAGAGEADGRGETGGGSFAVGTLWLMTSDIAQARQQLAAKGVATPEPENEGWGLSSSLQLPSEARLGLYQPLHPTALDL